MTEDMGEGQGGMREGMTETEDIQEGKGKCKGMGEDK